MDEGLQRMVIENPTVDALKNHLKEAGIRTLKDYGYAKVLEGLTTIEEVQRVSTVEI